MTRRSLRTLIMATLLTMLISFLGIFVASSTKGGQSPNSSLLDTVAQYRPLEAQLSVGGLYAPCAVVEITVDHVPWSNCSKSKGKDLKKIYSGVEKSSTSDSWSLGLFYLLIDSLYSLDLSIGYLDKSNKEDPGDPAKANDLAAALIERAGRRNQPEDLIVALDLLEGGIRRNPGMAWLLFNRALVLEKLSMLTLARQAWMHYLETDSPSDWKNEARLHLAKLDACINSFAAPVRKDLGKASVELDIGRLKNISARYPREAREFALEGNSKEDGAVGKWAKAVIVGRPDEAERWFTAIKAIGEELAGLKGDRTALEVAEQIKSVQLSSMAERKLAQGYDLYSMGHKFLQARDYTKATPLLAQSQSYLAAVQSPLVGWVRLDLGIVELYIKSTEVELVSNLLLTCNLDVYPSLCGRAAWVKGLGLFRLGKLAQALAVYRLSEKAFLLAHEADNRAAVLSLIAETLRELGDSSSAWRYRYLSLRVLGGQSRHRSSHNLLWEGGQAALEEGYHYAAEQFANEDVALFGTASDTHDTLLALESYLRRAQISRKTGTLNSVLEDLDRAVTLSQKLPLSDLQARIEADVQLVRAEIEIEHGIYEGERSLSQAFSFFKEHGLALREASTLLVQGRLARAQGRTIQAQEDLALAIELSEFQHGQLGGEDQRVYRETLQAIYGELMELAASTPGGIERAVQWLERSRNGDLHVMQKLSSIDNSVIVVDLALHSNNLYRFRIYQGRVTLEKFTISRSALADAVGYFASSLRAGHYTANFGRQISRLLVPDNLPDDALLCFVPDRELSEVPFGALLESDGSPLVVKHEVVIANSVYDCGAAKDQFAVYNQKEKVLLVSSPKFDRREFPALADLRAASGETNTLRKLYKNLTILENEHATASALIGALEEASIFHYVGHAVGSPKDPWRSFFPLAPESPRSGASLLSASDISKLRLPNLKLAVLSACDTLTPYHHRTEGISGLVRALLDAGTRAVVGRLWSIDDERSRHFLAYFYESLRVTGRPSAALRAAQLDSINTPDVEGHSIDNQEVWAGFELVVQRRNKI